jgi:alkylated DNA repair dioxygenase AlkB
VDPGTLRIRRDAVVERHDLDAGSWVELARSFVVDPIAELADVLAGAAWAQQEVLRYDRYVPERRLSAGLRADAAPLTRHTDMHLQSRYRVPFTGVAAIWYRDGDDFQGLHSDREMRWLDDTIIAIVVLGARRPFVFRPRDSWVQAAAERVPAGRGAEDVVLAPGEGDLLVMGGACQRDWLHGVPAAPDVADARVSLTWRWTSKRGRPDTNPGYFEGRQFGDGPRRPGTRTAR